jgi:hypothetical protein
VRHLDLHLGDRRPRVHDLRQHAGSRIMPGSGREVAFRV